MTPPPPTGSSHQPIGLSLGLSLVLATGFAAALWPTLRAVPSNLQVAPWALVAYLLSLVPYTLARAIRWHPLVRPLGDVKLYDTVRVSLAGYMWIALLPFRLGELARPLFLAQRSPITVQQALGPVAIERILDGLIVCALFFVARIGRPPPQLALLSQATTGVVIALVSALIGLVVMARWPHAVGRVIDATVGRGLPRVATWASSLSRGVAQGLAALPRARAVATFFGLTLMYWGSNAVGLWVLAQGCGLNVNPADAVLIMAVMNLVLLVPGGPAQLGIFQTGVALGLHLALPDADLLGRGSTFAFYLYVGQLSVIVMGGWGAQHSLHLNWRSLFRPPTTAPHHQA